MPTDPLCGINCFSYNKRRMSLCLLQPLNYKPIHLLLKITLSGLMHCIAAGRATQRERH